MECPFCYTNFEYHLSICTSCGKDTDDPVYKELFSRVKPRKIEAKTEIATPETRLESMQEEVQKIAEPVREKVPTVTAEIRSKDTCKTLMDFPHKQAEIPEWRRELQTRIKDIQTQRGQSTEAVSAQQAIPAKKHAIGGTGFAMAVLETPPQAKASPLVEKALARIEQSRLKNEPVEQKTSSYTGNYQPLSFQPLKTVQPVQPAIQPAQHAPASEPVKRIPRTIPFPEESSFGDSKPFVFSEGETVETRLPEIERKFKEKLAQAAELRNELITHENFTTSKLRKPAAFVDMDSFRKAEVKEDTIAATVDIIEAPVVQPSIKTVTAEAAEIEPTITSDEELTEEIAPFVYRFNAGFFDLIISAFLSLLVLSPFIMLSGNWLSVQGALAFLVTCSIVMFLYITASVGMIGRTLGMNLFSLEMIDAEDSDYPTFHQAAVSASVYIVSLALGGLGFATMFWNDDRRAVHDLISGTVIVREV